MSEMLQYYEAGETVEFVIARADNGEYKEVILEVEMGLRVEKE